MSNYFSDFNAVDNKLVELLDDNQLIRHFNTDGYPITLTVAPNVSPEAQMVMYAAEDGTFSRDARLIFSFPVGEIGVKVTGNLAISDALMNKIKGFAKKMHYLYLQGEYAMRCESKGFTRVQRIWEDADDEDAATDVDGDADSNKFAGFFEDDGGHEAE